MEALLRELMGKIDIQFDQMGKRLDGIDLRLDGMDKRFDEIDLRLDGMDKRFDGIDGRLDGVRGRIETFTETINNQATEFRSHFKQIHTRLDEHGKIFSVVADELVRD
ncbi:hypothetical protein DRW41_07135 [Neobacillus piezotolerans]|uniref:t-SNARE coiled-coil homology domain-containing protein n=1 Tax=Neobacillus piezotolerans TaxID=2259171 RepID=A0A3D8GT38_9BACI|nr:hypothetical protein [Neobacillus piezotolerans]RDU37608.1 hypothetical protein DRW41_07135 [Neobacillus piezotolerans]